MSQEKVGRESLRALAAFCLAVAVSFPASALAGRDDTTAEKRSPAHDYFTDVVLFNQDGEPMRLYTDLIEGKVVVINVFFTACTGVCPPLNKNMAAIQEALGDRLGREVYLISISVDPLADTPPRLKKYARAYRAKPGWYFLTGKKEDVEFALEKLGNYVERKEDHKNVILIGNDRTGLWKKAFGLARAEDLIQVVESVWNDRGQGNGGKD